MERFFFNVSESLYCGRFVFLYLCFAKEPPFQTSRSSDGIEELSHPGFSFNIVCWKWNGCEKYLVSTFFFVAPDEISVWHYSIS